MRSLRHLEKLTLGRNPYTEMFFHALSECSSLRKLSIMDSVLGNGGAAEVVLRHEGLLSLQMLKCRVVRITIRCPQLEELSLKRTSTASAILQCPRLTSLDVSHCHKLSDTGVRTAAIACPLLVSLNISHCAFLTDDTLREILLACTQLQTLYLSSCPNISLQADGGHLAESCPCLARPQELPRPQSHRPQFQQFAEGIPETADGFVKHGVAMPSVTSCGPLGV